MTDALIATPYVTATPRTLSAALVAYARNVSASDARRVALVARLSDYATKGAQ